MTPGELCVFRSLEGSSFNAVRHSASAVLPPTDSFRKSDDSVNHEEDERTIATFLPMTPVPIFLCHRRVVVPAVKVAPSLARTACAEVAAVEHSRAAVRVRCNCLVRRFMTYVERMTKRASLMAWLSGGRSPCSSTRCSRNSAIHNASKSDCGSCGTRGAGPRRFSAMVSWRPRAGALPTMLL